MKTIRVIFALMFFAMMTATPAPAASSKTYACDPPTTWATTPPTPLNAAVDIDHYNLKWGTSPGSYPNVVNMGKVCGTTITPAVPAGTTIYGISTAVTATTSTHAGGIESVSSNVVSYVVPVDETPTSGCSNGRWLP
jgi:hypothetical protein